MPLRRRPPAPSPRVRALLASHPQDTAVPGTVTPWQPERAWVLASADAAASGPATSIRPGRPGRHRRPGPTAPRLFTLPMALRGARVTAPRAAIVGVLLVVMAAAALFATRVVLAREAGAPRPVPAAGARGSALTTATSSRTPFGRSLPATSQNGTPAPTKVGATAAAGTVTVHVVGQVRQPGVVTLATGSRVVDAVAKAGGALRTADLPALNLARVLVDGEQIRVTRPGESPVIAAPTAAAGGGGGAAGGAGAAGSGGESPGSSAPGPLLNLNQATAAQLEELPGVGPVLAQRIVEWRTAHGRFATVDELGEVSGIGDKIFDELRTRVTV